MENVLVVVRVGSAHRARVNALRLEYAGGGPRRSSAGRGFGQGTWSACYTGYAGPVQTAIRTTFRLRRSRAEKPAVKIAEPFERAFGRRANGRIRGGRPRLL